MAYALDRQHARLVRAYERLRELYGRSLADRQDQRLTIHDLRLRVRELERELALYDKASKGTMGRLFASTQYAISHLVAAGDEDGALKLAGWMEDMRGRMRPVSDVRELIELLDEWAGVAAGEGDMTALYMRTMQLLGEVRGRADDR